MHISIRGNLRNPGDLAPRRFLRVLSGEQRVKFADGSGTVVERMEIAHEESIFTYTITANDALPMENYCATVMLSDTGDGGTNVSYGSNWDPKGIEEDEMRTMLEDLYGAILDAVAKG